MLEITLFRGRFAVLSARVHKAGEKKPLRDLWNMGAQVRKCFSRIIGLRYSDWGHHQSENIPQHPPLLLLIDAAQD